MLYRLLSIASFIMASSITLQQAVFAQTSDIIFTGTILPQTAIDILSIVPTNYSVSAKTNNQYNSTICYKINIQTSQSSQLNISQPQLVSGPTPEPSGTKNTVSLKLGSNVISSDVGYANAILPAGETKLEVDILVKRPKTFRPGTYNYVVMLTSLPN
jgi:hypothetical protein